METITIQAEGKKYKALIAFLEVLEIPFNKSRGNETELDRRVREARAEKATGQLKEIDAQNVWESIA